MQAGVAGVVCATALAAVRRLLGATHEHLVKQNGVYLRPFAVLGGYGFVPEGQGIEVPSWALKVPGRPDDSQHIGHASVKGCRLGRS